MGDPFGAPEAILFRGTHLLFALVLVFLLYRRTGETGEAPPTIFDYALLALGAAPIVYLFLNYDYVVTRIYYIDDLTAADTIFAMITVVIVMEATRRVIGWALPITAIVFLTYGLLIARLEPMRLLDQLFMTTEGVFGIPLSVSAAYVLIFVLFGSFMECTGAGQLFMDFALSLTGHTAGGPGKVSCVSSGLFGTISGSAVANVMVDGPITIPLMKRSGFPAILPRASRRSPPPAARSCRRSWEPLRSSWPNSSACPTAQVVIWALIPSILYYVACFAAVHFEAKRRGSSACRAPNCRAYRECQANAVIFSFPILIILGVMYSGYSSPLAALAGTLACFPAAALRKSTRLQVTLQH